MPRTSENFLRLLQLIEDVFETRNDPNQLQVDEKVMNKLKNIHTSTITELSNDKGPYCWILMIPTTQETMQLFLNGKINEQELLDVTNIDDNFNCLYLCSAVTLPEYRTLGQTKKAGIEAILEIQKKYPIHTLYNWPYTKEGAQLAYDIATTLSLNLLEFNPKVLE